MVDFDALVLPDKNIDEILRTVKLAEEQGFASAYVADSPPFMSPDVYASLSLAAGVTQTIGLGTGVTNPVTRHASVTAAAIGTVERLAPGRARLGIGFGYAATQAVGLPPATRKEMTEYVDEVRERLVAAGLGLPILVAASGPKTLATAGAVGDGVIMSVGTHPAFVRAALTRIEQGLESAGRDRDEIEIVALCGLAIGEDWEEVRHEAAPITARRALDVKLHPQALPDELEHLRADAMRVADAYDVHRHTEAGDVLHNTLVTDDLIDACILAGTPDRIEQRIIDMAELGVDRLLIFPSGERRYEAFEAFGRDVLPRFAG